MHRTALVTLDMRELDRLKVIEAVADLGLKPGRAAERLGLTVRQIERLVIRYREFVRRVWPHASVAAPATGGWMPSWLNGC